MKQVILFLLFLCFTLSGVQVSAVGSANNNKNSYALKQQAALASTRLATTIAADDVSVVQNAVLNHEDDLYIISLEDEDENEDIIRKHVSLARYYLAFHYAFLLSPPLSFVDDLFYSSINLSYAGSSKYIVQRTLRI